jgi:hypothetical protein
LTIIEAATPLRRYRPIGLQIAMKRQDDVRRVLFRHVQGVRRDAPLVGRAERMSRVRIGIEAGRVR